MATIYTRASKGSALTWTEGDANITNLNTAKLESENSGTTGQLLTKTSTGAQWETFSGGASTLNDLTDVTLSGPGADQVLKYDTLTNKWINGTAPAPSIALDGLSDVTTTTPSNGQALIYNGSTFQWENQTISSGGGDLVDDTSPQLGGDLDVNGNKIVSVSDGNIVIEPNGTGQTVVKNLEYNEHIHSLGTTSGTVAPNAANGNIQTLTLNGNLTLNAFTNPVAGQSITLIVNTNGTGRTLTSNMKWAGGVKTFSATSTTDIISVFYDGTNYWASISKGYV